MKTSRPSIRVCSCAFAIAILAAFPLVAADVPASTNVPPKNVRYDIGADLRVRYDVSDNQIGGPDHHVVNGEYYRQLRFRLRPYFCFGAGDHFASYLRMNWAWRDFSNISARRKMAKFPDEFFVDNFYIQVTNLFDGFLDLKIGRQDYIPGSGRVIADGTPGDGGRSYYFDMVKATLHVTDKSALDLGLIYDHYRNPLDIGNAYYKWDLTSFGSGGAFHSDDYSQIDERAALAYYTNKHFDYFPFELYWIWKQETRQWRYAGGTRTRYPGRQYQTLGTRLMPRLSDHVTTEFELAGQVGTVEAQGDIESRDILAGMAYEGITYDPRGWKEKPDYHFVPKTTLGCLYLSGDRRNYYRNDGGGTDHGWDPVFGRTPFFSEYYCINGYDNARWSNILYPSLSFEWDLPTREHVVTASGGPMFAPVKDEGAPSHSRGWFGQFAYDFPVLPWFFSGHPSYCSSCGDPDVTHASTPSENVARIPGRLYCRLMYEILAFGDYYEHDGNPYASWFRVEVRYTF